MIVYFDTSALVALYVEDTCSRHARTSRARAQRIATSTLAYAETLAAFARRRRERVMTDREHERVIAAFLADWPHWVRIRLNHRLLPEIRRTLKFHPLKGADAVHLASALLLQRHLLRSKIDLRFAADDRALLAAARADGLALAW